MIDTNSLIKFIKDNYLEKVPCQTEFTDQLVWSVFLDEEHLEEIKYSYYFDGETTIQYLQWSPDPNDCGCKATDLTRWEALFRRGILK